MNDRELEERLQSYYTTFTPESSGRAVASVDRTLAERRAHLGRPLAGFVGRLSVRGVGALAGLVVAVALVAALFPLWGRTGIGPAANGSAAPVGPTSALVGQAGVARDGAVWAVRGQGLSISRDHGQTWTEHRLPTDAIAPGNLAVVDADHAWFLDPSGVDAGFPDASGSLVVYRTSDGGVTWKSVSVAANGLYQIPMQFKFVDDKVGFLVLGQSLGNGELANAGASIIMRTEDGGASWTATGTITSWIKSKAATAATAAPVAPDPSPGAIAPDAPWFFAGPVIPVDADTLWTYCGIPVSVSAVSSCPLLQVSHDAGATWNPVSLPGLGGTGNEALYIPFDGSQPSQGVQFISSTEGYLAVLDTLASHERVHYFRTTDGGRTWSEVATTEWLQVSVPPIFIDSQHWFQPGIQTLVIPKAGATAGYLVESQGINVTSDGGKTWRNVGASMGLLSQVWMSDALHGAAMQVVVNGTPLYLTSDGGETWQAANLGPARWPDPTPILVTVPPLGSGAPGASPSAARSISPSAEPSATLPVALPSTPPAASAGASSGN